MNIIGFIVSILLLLIGIAALYFSYKSEATTEKEKERKETLKMLGFLFLSLGLIGLFWMIFMFNKEKSTI